MFTRRVAFLLPGLLTAFACLHGSAPAQCAPQWLPGDPVPSPRGHVTHSTIWDPDGAGPALPLLVVGGEFVVGTTTEFVATYDGTTWSPLGVVGANVVALAVHNGALYAATSGTAVLPARVIVWNGLAWQQIGANPYNPSFAFAMASYNGRLVVAGAFNWISAAQGLVQAGRIASWDGNVWAPLGAGLQGVPVALEEFNGSLYVGGIITSAGGVAAANLVAWNGSSWSAGPSFNGPVNALAKHTSIVVADPQLFVGGEFTTFSIGTQTYPAPHIASLTRIPTPTGVLWTWGTLGGGLPGSRCTALLARSVGPIGSNFELVAGVESGTATQLMWRWNGATWTPLGNIEDSAFQIWPSTIRYFGGRYTIGLDPLNYADAVRAWDGASWSAVNGPGIPGPVHAVEPRGSDVVIGGSFTTISGVTVNHIARGSAGAWSPLGAGVAGGLGVFALATAANSDLIAAGDFTTAGGQPANHIARWNGSAWSPLGAGLDATVMAVLALPNGDIVAAGDFMTAGGVPAARIARWNGSTWSALGAGLSARVNALALLANGDIVAGGNFLFSGGQPANRIARWNGSTWAPLGSGCNDTVYALATAPNGDLYAGGLFTSAGGLTTRVARWSSGSWSATPQSFTMPVRALAVHPTGTVLIGGGYASPSPNQLAFLYRVPGSLPLITGEVVSDIAIVAGGDVVIGGRFFKAEPHISANVARLDLPCPATAAPYGAGCQGLTAQLELTALAAPWIGTTMQLRASTFGPLGLALQMFGFTQLALPLPPLLPGSLPGCQGLTTAEITAIHVPAQGVVTIPVTIPTNPLLIGFQFFGQVLQFEPATGGGLAISTTNALQLVVGLF